MKKKIFSILAAVCCSVGLMAQDTPDYFSMTATEANVTVKLVGVDNPTAPVTIQYSTDKSEWTNIVLGTTEITVAPGTPVYFRNANSTAVQRLCTSTEDINNFRHLNFTMSGAGKIALGGQIRSLLDQTLPTTDTKIGGVAFYGLFENCTNIVSIADGLFTKTKFNNAKWIFQKMFKGCSHLTNVPSTFPTGSLNTSAFESMFEGCTSLTTVSDALFSNYSGSALSSLCKRMFYGCTNLTNAPKLSYFTATQSTSCYESMFESCEKLEVAPDLNQSYISDLQADCYKRMFYGCTSLRSIKVGFPQWTNSSAQAFTTDWLPNNEGAVFNGPTSLINAVSANRTTSTIPSNWTMEIAPVEIKANGSTNATVLGNLIGKGAQKILLSARPIKANMWNTICLPFAMTEAQVAATFGEGTLIGRLTRGETRGEELFIDFATDVTAIEAGVPYIIKPGVAEDIANPLFEDVIITKSVVDGNYTKDDVHFQGTFGVILEQDLEEGSVANYYGLGTDQMIHPIDNGGNGRGLFGFRAYFHWIKPAGASSAPKRVVLNIDGEQTTTADEQLKMDEAVSTKMMVNGQLVIVRDGIRYNAQGQVIQ